MIVKEMCHRVAPHPSDRPGGAAGEAGKSKMKPDETSPHLGMT
jgi:hypothetical protein